MEHACGAPFWKAQRVSSDQSVTITPCEPIELRLMEVRIPWEPSSFVEDSDHNVLVKLIGKWQTPDGGAAGLNLQATDLQVLRAYEPECPF